MASTDASSTAGSYEVRTGFDENIGSPAGSKTPESLSGCHSPGSPGSPIRDDACPICLGNINDKCAAGSCLHYFCLVCLKEWSKQKAVCPLCKQAFTKILYEIKSETDYKEWIVPKRITDPQSFASTLTEFLRSTERSFFGYRTTNTGGVRSHILNVAPRRRRMVPYLLNRSVLPNGPREMFGSYRNQQRGSSSFRSSIYINNLWVQPLSDITGQYRESSPDLYREQPALTHRLVPWVNREVAALLSPSRVSVVLVEIMDLIERYPINSREFCRAIRPHFGSRTSHFVHEFYNFARSPYDMVGHDNAARYVTRFELENDVASDSEDDDEVIEVESNGDPVQPLDLSARPAIEEVLANDGSVIISSGNSSSSDEDGDNHDYTDIFSETRNPDPPSEYNRYKKKSKSSQRNNEGENYSSNFDEPGPSGISSSNVTVKRESDENVNNLDECLIVNVLKPKKERTPEIIDLSSDTDVDRTKESTTKKTHWKKKIGKQVESKCASKVTKKVKKPPRLDRNSFSLHFSGTMNCNHISHSGRLREDHNYCGSASNQNGSELDSEEETERVKKSTRSHASRKVVSRKQIHLALSDTESDSDLEIRRREKTVNSRLLIKGTSNKSCLRGCNVDSDSDQPSRYKKKSRPSKNSKVVQKISSKMYQSANTDSNMIAGHLSRLNRKSKPNETKKALDDDESLKVRRSSRLVSKSYAWGYEFSSDDESEVSKSYWSENETVNSTRSEHNKAKSKTNKTKLTDSLQRKKLSKHRSKSHVSKTKTTSLMKQLSALIPDSSSSQNSSRTSYFISEDSDSSSSSTISSICSSSCTDTSSLHFKRPSKKRLISFSDSSSSGTSSYGSQKNKASKSKSLNSAEISENKSKKKSKKVKEVKNKKKSKEVKKKKKNKSEKKHSKRSA